MRLHSAIAIGYVVHALIGSVCMMPMAYAQETTEHGGHAHMEMVMTPAVPMSPADCRSCIAVELKQAPPFSVSCASGNCVSDAPVTLSAVIQNMTMQEILPPSPVITLLPSETASSVITSCDDPPPVFITRTIVLQL